MAKKSEFSGLGKKLTVETTGEFKNLSLTDEQYRRLITLLKVGIIAVCNHKDHVNVPLIDIDQYINSFSKDFNSQDLLQFREEYGMYTPTSAFASQVDFTIKLYGDRFINQELGHRLATRDLSKRSPDDKKFVTLNDKFEKSKSDYIAEFEKNDLKNVIVKIKK
jgi:hypothetical protein